MNRLVAAGVAFAVSAAVLGAAAPAQAADLGTAKKEVTVRIDLRVATLRALNLAVGQATRLTPGHKSTLSSLLATDISGLQALRTKVAGETTIEGVRADRQSMIDDYRVYMLVAPKVRLTIVSDAETTIAGRLQKVHDKEAEALAKAKDGGADTSSAQAKLADMQAQIDHALSAIAGKADGLLAVNPSPDPNAMRAATQPVRTAVHSARADLRAAVADAKRVQDFLKGLK